VYINVVHVVSALVRLNPKALEAAYREREAVCEPAAPPFAVRLDGVGFGKRLRYFPHPRSRVVHEALVETAKTLAATYGADLVHVVSDEINLIFLGQAPYGGRTFKIVSVLAAHAASELTARLARPLYFDGRVIRLRDKCDAATYVLYRARVGLNNYVVQLARETGLIHSHTPHIEELLPKVEIADFELAWGTAMKKEGGYRRGDLCETLATLCDICTSGTSPRGT